MVETNVKYAVTVVVGLIVAILVSVISPVFLPLGDSIKKFISGEPDTKITNAFTFNVKNGSLSNVNYTNATIVTKSITFTFDASQYMPLFGAVQISGFECSMDGAPFEDCVSPKSYSDLQSDAVHHFQVRAKGLLGNVDPLPADRTFNIMTSATVQGVIRENNQGSKYNFFLNSDSPDQKKNYTTDRLGIFRVYDIKHGLHLVEVPTNNGSRYDLFFVPSGETMITKSFEITNMSQDIISPSLQVQLADPGVTPLNHSFFNATNNTNLLNTNRTSNITLSEGLEDGQKDRNSNLSLYQETKPSLNPQNPFLTQIWLNASKEVLFDTKKVIYHLHPTFNPSDVESSTQSNNFSISFSNWGIFDIRATVYSKSGETTELVLPKEKWIIR